LTFASGLRSILRHDPDVVLVGEIRDVETADIAIQASLTGHLVFSTLHTNDAPSAMTRLVDMGIEPYLVASSLEAVFAQRLVRVICSECKEPLPAKEVRSIKKEYGDSIPDTLYAGKGCRSCQGTGYRGRIGIFELMLVTDEIRSLIFKNVSARDIRHAAARNGMSSLREDGFRHLREGGTQMPKFQYTAIDPVGKEVTATLDAPSRTEALDQLTGRDLYPVVVQRKKDTEGAGLSLSLRRVSKTDVEAFTRELANLLAAGVPLSRALSILSREASRPAAKQLWATIHDQVAGGQSLAESNFPPVYIAMVRAGETGGFLDLVLEQIASFRSREQDLIGKVKAALIYPAVLTVLAAGILIFLLTYFIPRFSQMFEQFGGALPALTQAIVAVSEVLIRFWFVLVLVFALIGFAVHRVMTTEDGRRSMEKVMLRTPLFGKAIGRFALVRFCRMLGTLVRAGVPLISALQVAKEAIGNQALADTVTGAIDQVQQGNPLARSLERCAVLFPASVIEMISVAEESGRLDDELVRLAGAYEQDLDRHLKMMVALAEPALLFVMAVLVGTVVIGMLLPIFNLQELIR